MKKILVFILLLAIVLSVAACTGKGKGDEDTALNVSEVSPDSKGDSDGAPDEENDPGLGNGEVPDKGGFIKLNKSQYQVGEDIVVTVTGITKEMEKSLAFVAIYRADAMHDEWMGYEYLPEGDSIQSLPAPGEGEYEMRLYSSDLHGLDDNVFVMSVPFTVV